jgi:1-acyl-sn-glycerol-3-phosphate acyltransferase
MHIAAAMRDAERRLVDINGDDILAALGLGNMRVLRKELKLLFRYPARGFARAMLRFDDAVEEQGIDEAAAELLSLFASGLSVSGTGLIPRSGPALFVANHPGITDTAALFRALGRKDLKIIAAARPFLLALPSLARHLILVPEDPSKAGSTLRPAVAHLRAGGALLTFPAGAIEPDPAVAAGAIDSLDTWFPSPWLFVRMVPEAKLVPVVVSGVLAPRAQHSIFTLIRRRHSDRRSLGAMLQVLHEILIPGRWKTRVRVDILQPLEGRVLAAMRDREAVLDMVRAEMVPRLREIQDPWRPGAWAGCP